MHKLVCDHLPRSSFVLTISIRDFSSASPTPGKGSSFKFYGQLWQRESPSEQSKNTLNTSVPAPTHLIRADENSDKPMNVEVTNHGANLQDGSGRIGHAMGIQKTKLEPLFKNMPTKHTSLEFCIPICAMSRCLRKHCESKW
jgi:hypothetical protein